MAKRNKKSQKRYDDSKFSKKQPKYSHEEKDLKDENSKDKSSKQEPWNKAEWYIPDEKIRQQVASFSMNMTTGVPEIIRGSDATMSFDWESIVRYGNVMSIDLFPYPGTVALTNYTGGVSALDTACRKLYTAISSVNSKTTQYTPESLGIAVLAVGELVSLISYATRAYGVAFTYNPRNRTIPSTILEAMGLSSTSFLDNLATYRMQLNKLITAANNIRMLKDLKYFTKCWEIYANYFEDGNSGMAQYYVMKPAGYLKYNELSPTQGELEWVPFTSGMTYGTLINHIQTCLNNLLTSSLMNYVYTDIVNYVTREGGELLGFSYVGELYTVLPIHDETFLTQIHNMTWGMFDLVTTPYKVAEDPNTLQIKATDIFKHAPATKAELAITGDRLLDFPFNDNPSCDDKIDAIAYMTIVNDIDNNGDPIGIAAPDHPVLNVTVFDSEGQIRTLEQCLDFSGAATQIVLAAQCFSTFSVAPMVYLYDFQSAGSTPIFPMAGLNYFTAMRFPQLKNIFDYSFLGLFDASVKSVKPF